MHSVVIYTIFFLGNEIVMKFCHKWVNEIFEVVTVMCKTNVTKSRFLKKSIKQQKNSSISVVVLVEL